MIQRTILMLIRGYQYFVSPMSAPSCRYVPNCSQYAAEAIIKHGPVKGGWLSIKRIFRCNPWSAGGYDSVP